MAKKYDREPLGVCPQFDGWVFPVTPVACKVAGSEVPKVSVVPDASAPKADDHDGRWVAKPAPREKDPMKRLIF